MKKSLHKLQHREFTVAPNGYYTVLKPARRFFSTLLHGRREHLVMSESDAAAMQGHKQADPLHQSLISEKSTLQWWYLLLAVAVMALTTQFFFFEKW